MSGVVSVVSSRRTVAVWYVESDGARKYHTNRDCRALQKAENPIEQTTADITDTDDGIELVGRGLTLCRYCSGA